MVDWEIDVVRTEGKSHTASSTGDRYLGAPGYICPAFGRTMQNYTSASAVFSMGIVFAEIFTGILQLSEVDGNTVDLFDRYSDHGYERKDLVADADASAGDWNGDVRREFASLTVDCISAFPRSRPSIRDVVHRLDRLAGKRRSPGEKNGDAALCSGPLLWQDKATPSQSIRGEPSELTAETSSPQHGTKNGIESACSNKQSEMGTKEIPEDVPALSVKPVSRDYLLSITDGFSNACLQGDGAFGEAFIGKDENLRRRFIVKRLANFTGDKEIFQSTALGDLRHPNVSRLRGYFISSDSETMPCLLFDLGAKGTLHQVLLEQRNNLHWTRKIKIALDVANALEYLHSGKAGFFYPHGDVRSANISVKNDYNAELLDCGLSRWITYDTRGNPRSGSRRYLCPEYLQSGEYTEASDVFSLGVVFTELFTGDLQFSRVEDKLVDLLEKNAEKNSGVWLTDVRHGFARLSLKCISVEPRNRPKISTVVQELVKLFSRAKPWMPNGKNRITILVSDPLVWKDAKGSPHPITISGDFSNERVRLGKIMAKSDRDIEVSFDVATVDSLRGAIKEPRGCLHVCAHGLPGRLLFEHQKQGSHWVDVEQLKGIVGIKPFRFVFLSACCSEVVGRAFVLSGVPHVVGCNDSERVPERHLQFTEVFYRSLLTGQTVKQAFDDGRKSVPEGSRDSFFLLPKAGDHNRSVFCDKVEWVDSPSRERFFPCSP